jgi:hypothetical protein
MALVIGVSTLTPTQANEGMKMGNWRPKDGLYGLATGKAAPCDSHPLSHIELSKNSIGADEVYKCSIGRITDAGPGRAPA